LFVYFPYFIVSDFLTLIGAHFDCTTGRGSMGNFQIQKYPCLRGVFMGECFRYLWLLPFCLFALSCGSRTHITSIWTVPCHLYLLIQWLGGVSAFCSGPHPAPFLRPLTSRRLTVGFMEEQVRHIFL